MLFAQISGKDSLREIENALLANHKRLYHLGMEAVAKSILSEAMNRRNPEIFKALFEEILDRVMAVAPKHKFKFKNPLYAIDSTTMCDIVPVVFLSLVNPCETATKGTKKLLAIVSTFASREFVLVEQMGVEPTTYTMRTYRSSQLSYCPNMFCMATIYLFF